MTSQDIQAFLDVVKYGTVMRAAEVRYISHSTLSWRISKLEQEVGAKLFTRSKGIKRVELTPAGKAFLPYAEKLSALLEDAYSAIKETMEPRLSIVIGYGHSLIFAPVYQKFYEQFTSAHLYYYLRHANEAYDLVATGKMTAGIVATAYEAKRVKTLPLCDEREVLVCGSTSDLAEKDTVSVEDLRGEQCVRWWLDGASVDKWLQQMLPNQTVSRIVTEDLSLLESTLSGSKRWSILPESTARIFSQRSGGAIRIKDADFEGPTRHLYLILRSNYEAPECFRQLMAIMHDEFVSLGLRWICPMLP